MSDCPVGSRTSRSAERSDEDVGIAGDERNRMHSCAVFTFCAVCCDASNSQRTGGGNVNVTVCTVTHANQLTLTHERVLKGYKDHGAVFICHVVPKGENEGLRWKPYSNTKVDNVKPLAALNNAY